MSEYSFRLADASDKTLITDFMDANWGSEHPLIHNESFFNYYYKNNNKLQFALCFSGTTLAALCGYIRCNNEPVPDIWVSIWLALKSVKGAGLELIAALPSLCGARMIACNNIRPKTMSFYRFLGYTAERLPHYYRLSDKTDYKICKIAQKIIPPICSGERLEKIESSEQLKELYLPSPSHKPYKDFWYLKRRYFDYPYEKYDLWKLPGGKKSDAILATRTACVNGVNIIRLVDFTGSPESFKSFGFGIDCIMKDNNAEYSDLYCFGIPSDEIYKAGFCERLESCENIIPNYLSPPLYENTEYYFFTSSAENFTMFKADGDQDRPNI